VTQQAQEGRDAMTETAAVNLNVILQSVRRSILTKDQVFRLWRCAIKDDDELVDNLIQHTYEDIIAFDCARAECAMGLIIRRHMAAGCVFKTLLKDVREVRNPKYCFVSPCTPIADDIRS
jgi:hypothetical protein